jgi:hypothetical protein
MKDTDKNSLRPFHLFWWGEWQKQEKKKITNEEAIH